MESTKRLRYLCAVQRTGSIHAAARLCDISAPAMSRAIKLLEQELGTDLVVAAGRGIVLTERAEQVAAQALPLLDQLEALVHDRSQQEGAGTLRVGTFEYCSTWLAPALLGSGEPDAPGAVLLEAGPGGLERALREREVDVVVTHAPVPAPDLEFHPVTQALRMSVFGRAGRFDGLAVRDLPFAAPVTVATGTAAGLHELDGWPTSAAQREVRWRVSLLESALALCRAGHAVAWLPDVLVEEHNRATSARYRLAPVRYTGRAIGRGGDQRLYVGVRAGGATPTMWRLHGRLERRLAER